MTTNAADANSNESSDAKPGQTRPADDHASSAMADRPVHQTRTRTLLLLAVGLVCLLSFVLVAGLRHRAGNSRQLAAATRRAAAPPVVDVVRPQPAAAAGLSLPGTTQAITEAIIYARTNGYIGKRHVDIGDNVKTGQLLAEIDAPDLDQQLNQARAQLEQSIKNLQLQQASLELARTTMKRFTAAGQGAVSQEQIDQAVAAYQTAVAAVAAAQATVDASKANVQRFEQLTSFERVLAPFDGTITQRNVDVGALITAGSPTNNVGAAPTNTTGTASGLFELSRIDTLRVFVNVPQVFAPNVKPGLPARVRVRGQLATPVTAKVARIAKALDPATRTLLTEVDVPNASHTLFPGMFVYVDFEIEPAGTRFRVPATAVDVRAQGTRVVTVAEGNRLHFRDVVLGRDFGDAIDIQAGLNGNELIVKQPTVAMQEGELVTPREPTHATTNIARVGAHYHLNSAIVAGPVAKM